MICDQKQRQEIKKILKVRGRGEERRIEKKRFKTRSQAF